MLFDTLNPERDLILTANSRLALYLQTKFDDAQKKRHTTWESVRALPLDRWLHQQFHEANTDGLFLLSDFQEQCVWQDIIATSEQSKTLWQPREMARLAKQAFDYLTQWEVPLDSLTAFDSQLEVRCLIDWITAFTKKCAEKKWISASSIPSLLLTKKITLPDRIIIMGFDEFNPALKKLFQEIEKSISVSIETLSEDNALKQQVVLDTSEDEMTTMARFAKAFLAENPSAKIGCVVPNLGNIRTAVQRIFTEVFCIEHILPGAESAPLPFNISAGTALAKQPMIAVALSLLRFCQHAIPIDEVASLLQSQYVCHSDAERNQGAMMDAALRKKNYLTVSIQDVLQQDSSHPLPRTLPCSPSQDKEPSVSQVKNRWRAFQAEYNNIKFLKQKPSEWAAHFIVLLKTIGWPAAHTQTSEEFQVLERFKKTAQEFSQLDYIFADISFSRALQLLTTLTLETIFQPKSHHEPIQIMGALEASSILFDATWVMGMDDRTWPPATKPHPLIPFALQQQYSMPHATAKREHQFCKHITERLENSAKKVIFSSPHKEGDQHFSPSRLIQHIPLIDRTALALSAEVNYCEKILQSQLLETLDDDHAPAMTSFSHIRGGSSILKRQAECPFRAFSEVRLQAKKLETPAVGISPATKGTIIHQVLFYLWGELKDQQTLNALPDDALQQLISDAIAHVLNDPAFKTALSQNAYFFTVEKKRLQQLISEWFMLEKSRPTFKVVERECTADITIGNLPIKIQLDRVDQLSDGSMMLIDYKTKAESIGNWFEERLTNPQLPIYAVFTGENKYSAVSFAQMQNGNMTLRGVLHEDHPHAEEAFLKMAPINKIKNAQAIFDWNTLMQTWKASLEKLSADFCDGVAHVDPIDAATCSTCDLKPICRYTL